MRVVLERGDVLIVSFDNAIDKIGIHWRDESSFFGIVVTEISGSSDGEGRSEVLYKKSLLS